MNKVIALTVIMFLRLPVTREMPALHRTNRAVSEDTGYNHRYYTEYLCYNQLVAVLSAGTSAVLNVLVRAQSCLDIYSHFKRSFHSWEFIQAPVGHYTSS